MTSNWEKFKSQAEQQQTGDQIVPGRKIGGNYQCQFCKLSCDSATYYPSDSVLKYVCAEGHASFIENFKLAF